MSIEREHLLELSMEHDLISITVCYGLLLFLNQDNPLHLSNGYECSKFFTLHGMDSTITIRKDEMSRYCYLIDFLSNKYLKIPNIFLKEHMSEGEDIKELRERYRKEWVAMMLEVANISENHFKSHYRDAVKSKTKKNVTFKKNLVKLENMVRDMS